MNKFVALIVGLSAISVFGQTRAEIEAKVGKRVDAYSVGVNIWMTPDYAADGQVCRMRFYPKRFSDNTNFVGIKGLPFDEFRSAVDMIVPVASRGARKEPFENGWNGGGGVVRATFDYERLTIEYSFGARIDGEALRKSEQVDLDLPVSATKDVNKANNKAGADDFSNYHGSNAEIVTVVWKNRKCEN